MQSRVRPAFFIYPGNHANIGKLRLALTQDSNVNDYPDERDLRKKLLQSNCSFVLPSAVLARVFDKIAFAISTEETRYYLNGVFMHIATDYGKPSLAFATTDGHRLAQYKLDLPAGAGAMADAGAIIPTKAVRELLRLVKRKDCPAETLVSVTDTGISFKIGEDEHLESKLIDGTFPDYQRVRPANPDKKAVAYVDDLSAAIRQASAVLNERGAAVKFAIKPGKITLTCTDPEFGSASTEIKAITEDDLEIGFNAKYMLEILNHIEGAAEMMMNDAGDPAIINDTGDDAVTYVQMPMRV